MSRAAQILLLSNRRESRMRWAQILTNTGYQLLDGTSDLAHDESPDLVLTDLPSDDDAQGVLPQLVSHGDVGLIVVGQHERADVALPSDFSPRELRLACRLLIEIVNLRRRERRGNQMQETLTQLALSDPLTGLPNRRAWEEELQRRRRHTDATGAPLCLAILDMDQFKSINDAAGYVAGDAALKEIGDALVRHVRGDDFVARLGGDEFGLLFSGVEERTALRLVERLRCEIASQLARRGGPALTASAGLAVGGPGISRQQLFAAADRAVRQAKSAGRNRCVASAPQ